MTEEVFRGFFTESLKAMPQYAGLDVVTFVNENGIDYRLRVSDELVSRAEETNQRKYPAAITSFDDTQRIYWCVFRDAILDAPTDIARAVSWHEAIHAWVHPILCPARGFKKTPHTHFQKVSELRKRMADQKGVVRDSMTKDAYEEELVKFIAATWGSDESTALNWFLERTGS